MRIYCCGCLSDIEATLVSGREIYPHREDLYNLPFWACDCGLYVGCHHKTKNRTQPLGCIPTPEIKNDRQHIHKILDPLWKSGRYKRSEIYKIISDKMGRKYHTANIRSIEEAREVYRIIMRIRDGQQ